MAQSASLLREAKSASGATTDTAAVRLGLEALGAARAGHTTPAGASLLDKQSLMIVLVDTSVWIHFLANRPPYAGALDPLLGRDEVSGQAPLVPHTEVVQFVREGRLHGRGIGWIDAHLLASALVGRLMLWTADPRLAAVARELKIAYD